MVETAVIIVSGSDGILRVENRPNRSEECGDINMVDRYGADVSEGNDWFSPGWALKPDRMSGKI